MSTGRTPDVFHGQFSPDSVGLWTFRVDGWGDPIATWRRGVVAKLDAGQSETELSNDLLVGARLLERAATGMPRKLRDPLIEAAEALRKPGDPFTRAGAALSDEVTELLEQYPLRDLITRDEQYGVWVDRPEARFSAWYELFPRSTGGWDKKGKPVHGTFATAAKALPRIAKMGFDVVYLPPIHPIGKVHRKGRNNAVTAAPKDVGSPWAIGSERGGHDAVHPKLGTIEDFDDFVTAARDQGLEVALDLALQAAPDHPWAKEHPEWFTVLPDGTIAYAENPPKKYQDIYPINFDNDPAGLYDEVLRVVRYWISHGVKIFRVDNPHTKPPNFWAWLIGEVKADRPRRAVPRRGVHPACPPLRSGQTWLHPVLHVLHLAHGEVGADRVRRADRRARRLRPAQPVRQHARHPARKPATRRSRACSPSGRCWRRRSVRPGACIPATNCSSTARCGRAARNTWIRRSTNCAPAISRPHWPRANRSSRSWAGSTRFAGCIPLCASYARIKFHHIDNDALLAYSKFDPITGDTVLVVVTLNPYGPEESTLWLDMGALGMQPYDRFWVRDEITGEEYQWGQSNYVRIDPAKAVAHVLNMPQIPPEQRPNLLRRE